MHIFTNFSKLEYLCLNNESTLSIKFIAIISKWYWILQFFSSLFLFCFAFQKGKTQHMQLKS